MSEHTQGPYYVGAQNDMLYITVGKPPAMSNDYPDHEADRTPIAKAYSPDDARRIAACLNACSSIPTEDLEDSSMNIIEYMEDQYTDRVDNLMRISNQLRNGNTELIEALMGMVNQFFIRDSDTHDQNDVLRHSFMSAEEDAIRVLIDAGFAEELELGGYRLLWEKLEQRKKPMTWQDAVNLYVTDPAQRDKLLRMDQE
ncbi:hypothetical protein [Sideroxydans lithotrophicus]|uniref:Uncharacterized protein n=1 Tax=Sideroxydans lithotrophicus (strain ES-1) TaxID=580332 RepID=D5CTA0_SIDLE|nr:hypothetical protein [Sideroxydans lithotrophicus]ADE12186.1 hypothetical protein Slit_1957 [Sideroxydans lithotrophicus ES-1]